MQKPPIDVSEVAPIDLSQVGVPLSESEVSPPPNIPMLKSGSRSWAPSGWGQTPYGTAAQAQEKAKSYEPFRLLPGEVPSSFPKSHYANTMLGVAKGAIHTAAGIGELLPGTEPFMEAIRSTTEPEGGGQRFGYGLEQMAEYYPAIAGEKLVTGIPKVAGVLKGKPFLDWLARAGFRAGTSAGVAKVQDLDPKTAAGVQLLGDAAFGGLAAGARTMGIGQWTKRQAVDKVLQAAEAGSEKQGMMLRPQAERLLENAPFWSSRRWMRKFSEKQAWDAMVEKAGIEGPLAESGYGMNLQDLYNRALSEVRGRWSSSIKTPKGTTEWTPKQGYPKAEETLAEYITPPEETLARVAEEVMPGAGGMSPQSQMQIVQNLTPERIRDLKSIGEMNRDALMSGSVERTPYMATQDTLGMIYDRVAAKQGYMMKASAVSKEPDMGTVKAVGKALQGYTADNLPSINQLNKQIHEAEQVMSALGFEKLPPQTQGARVVMSGNVPHMWGRIGRATFYGSVLGMVRQVYNSAPNRMLQAKLLNNLGDVLEKGYWDRIGDVVGKSLASWQTPESGIDIMNEKANIPSESFKKSPKDRLDFQYEYLPSGELIKSQ